MFRIGSLVLMLLILVNCTSKGSLTSRSSTTGPEPQVQNDVQFLWQSKVLTVNSAWLASKRVPLISVAKRDPNSELPILYLGAHFPAVLNEVTKELGVDSSSVVWLELTALDGYVLKLKVEDLLTLQAFYVVDTPHLKTYQLYNKSLGVLFDWRPGYIVFFGQKKTSSGSSSPYQVRSVELLENPRPNPILSSTSAEHLEGARIFIESCTKCHSHLGYGGRKAPKIQLMTIRHPNDEDLAQFLRAPSKTLGRTIGMSAFSGTDQQLKSLVRYLRTLEKSIER